MEYTKSVLAEGSGVRARVLRDGIEVDRYYINPASLNPIRFFLGKESENRELVFRMCHKWADELIEVMKRQEC